MAPGGQGIVGGFVQRWASRLRHPQLFALLLGVFIADLLLPDFIPFADEIFLGLLTVMFGLWKDRRTSAPDAPPPMKDVTPRNPSP